MGRLHTVITPPIVTNDSNAIVAVNAPSKARMTALRIVGPTGFSVTLYNRAFTWSAPLQLRDIREDAGGNTVLRALSPLPLEVGDEITVASSSVSGYNTGHIVTQVLDAVTVVTDQTHTADATGGTVTLAISNDQPLYQILPVQSDGDNAGATQYYDNEGVIVTNKDPLPVGQHSKTLTPIYCKFSDAGTYRVSFSFASPD